MSTDRVGPAERAAALRARVAADRKRNRCIPCTWGDGYGDAHNAADPLCPLHAVMRR